MAALFAFGASDAEKNYSTEMNAVACGDMTSEGDVKALFPEGARVARTIRPEGTGFSFAPGRQEYRPLSDDYRVFIDGREAEVRACRESRVPFNRTWPGRQRPLDQSVNAMGSGPMVTSAVMIMQRRR